MIVQFLRDIPGRRIRTVPRRHKQTPVRSDGDPPARLRPQPFRRHCRLRAEQHFHLAQRGFVDIQHRPCDTRIAVRPVAILKEREEDPPVRRKMRIRGHIQHPDPLRTGQRQPIRARYALRQNTLAVQDPDTSRQPFRHQQFPARQKRHAPRRGQTVDQRGYLVRCGPVIRRARLLRERGLVVGLLGRTPLDRPPFLPRRLRPRVRRIWRRPAEFSRPRRQPVHRQNISHDFGILFPAQTPGPIRRHRDTDILQQRVNRLGAPLSEEGLSRQSRRLMPSRQRCAVTVRALRRVNGFPALRLRGGINAVLKRARRLRHRRHRNRKQKNEDHNPPHSMPRRQRSAKALD